MIFGTIDAAKAVPENDGRVTPETADTTEEPLKPLTRKEWILYSILGGMAAFSMLLFFLLMAASHSPYFTD